MCHEILFLLNVKDSYPLLMICLALKQCLFFLVVIPLQGGIHLLMTGLLVAVNAVPRTI